ncbi:uncharacterized protein K02A2.6-like [Coccinella septempunctata]|uniref:uncharacterized protein K02A2.6-like n=1 Tax=Coccinella septempunctata TaxID=41139 RepID=UPI001D07CFE7|nr:uncharacterized protein K02A2.6-like [Coccinella septempunctata]
METRTLEPMPMKGNSSHNWMVWKQKFLNYLIATEASEKPEAVQCAKLIYFIGDEGLEIYNTFSFTDAEKDKIEPLIAKFEQYFVPKKNVDFERYKFFTLRQHHETIEQFVTILKNTAKNCEFHPENEDGLIKTMFVIGVKSESLREKLLQNIDLKLNKAVELCLVYESAKSQCELMKNGNLFEDGFTKVDDVRENSRKHRLQASTSKVKSAAQMKFSEHRRYQRDKSGMNKNIKNCSRCGYSHPINKCLAYKKKCSKCGKLNHSAACCKMKNINFIDDSNEQEGDFIINCINELHQNNNHNKDWSITLQIENIKIKLKIDTGACVNIINYKDFLDLKKKQNTKIVRADNKLISYTGNKIPVIGNCFLNINYRNKLYNLEFLVVKGDQYQAIIGLDTCLKLNLIKKVEAIENNNLDIEEYKNLINEYEDIFKGIGKLNKHYHIELKDDAVPCIHPVRKVPFAIESKYKETLEQLVKKKIIEPVEGVSTWVNPVVIVKKKNGNLRICLDPQDLNKSIKREYFKLPTIDELISKLNGACYFSVLDAASGFWNIPLDEASSELCTFGTPFGRFRFLRMPYGLKSAPEVFQKRFKEIFDGEGTEVYIDDLFVLEMNMI